MTPQQIELSDGRKFELKEFSGTWSVSIDGVNYCASTPATLREGIARHFHLAWVRVTPVIKHQVDQCIDVLKDPNSSLIARQEAHRHLKNWDASGHQRASRVIEHLNSKPAPSRQAQAVALLLNKRDFAEVTHEELVEYIHDLVSRSRLMLELGDRLKLEGEHDWSK